MAVTFTPKNFKNKMMIIGFKTGDAIKKEMVPPNGAPLLNNPTRIGMVEQEQKGVIAPSAAPIIFCSFLCGLVRTFLMVSFEMYLCSKATIKLMIRNRTMSSIKMSLKKSQATVKLFTLNISYLFLVGFVDTKSVSSE